MSSPSEGTAAQHHIVGLGIAPYYGLGHVMPEMPPTFKPRGIQTKPERDREHDAKRRAAKPWRKWYYLRIWKVLRRRQLDAHPWCQRCEAKGIGYVLATVVNHNPPHRGDWNLFVNGPKESLCDNCHNAEVQAEERAAERTGQG